MNDREEKGERHEAQRRSGAERLDARRDAGGRRGREIAAPDGGEIEPGYTDGPRQAGPDPGGLRRAPSSGLPRDPLWV